MAKEKAICKFEGCSQKLGHNNKSGYCQFHRKAGNRIEEMKIRSDDKLKEIAEDIFKERIFTSLNLNADQVGMCFVAVHFLDNKIRRSMKRRKVTVLFEYMDQAGPMSVNGLPCFFSFRTLTDVEAKKVQDYYLQMKNAVGQISAVNSNPT